MVVLRLFIWAGSYAFGIETRPKAWENLSADRSSCWSRLAYWPPVCFGKTPPKHPMERRNCSCQPRSPQVSGLGWSGPTCKTEIDHKRRARSCCKPVLRLGRSWHRRRACGIKALFGYRWRVLHWMWKVFVGFEDGTFLQLVRRFL